MLGLTFANDKESAQVRMTAPRVQQPSINKVVATTHVQKAPASIIGSFCQEPRSWLPSGNAREHTPSATVAPSANHRAAHLLASHND
jgi:hypothetical protein